MDTFPERIARAILLAVGVSAVLLLLALPAPDGAAMPLLLHHQFLITLLAVALIGAAFIRTIRPGVVAAGLLSQAGFVGIALLTPGFIATDAFYLNLTGMAALLCAGLLLMQTARRQARWDGRIPRRMEV